MQKLARASAAGTDRLRAPLPSSPGSPVTGAALILKLQRACGNAAVMRALLARTDDTDAPGSGGLAILPGSPEARHAEQKQQAHEAKEWYERHLRETGERPKEHQIRMAADPRYRAEQYAEASEAISEAFARIKERERYAADIVAGRRLPQEQRWRETWTESAVTEGIKGMLDTALQSDKERELQGKVRDSRRQLAKLQGAGSGQSSKPVESQAPASQAPEMEANTAETARKLEEAHRRLASAEATLKAQEPQFSSHRARQATRKKVLIDAIVDPKISAHRLSLAVEEFLRNAPVDTNLRKKLSEVVSAKAVWFSLIEPVALAPGPKAVGKSDSPDYVSGADIIGDNFRVEGVSPARGQVVLDPSPLLHWRQMESVLNAVIKGIKSKVTTYFQSHVRAGKRVVVTVDVSDCPWVMNRDYLAMIANVGNEWAGSSDEKMLTVSDCLRAVYLVANGRAHRAFPGWPAPVPIAQPAQAATEPLEVAPPAVAETKAKKVNVKGPSKATPLALGLLLEPLVARTRVLLGKNAVALRELDHVLQLFTDRRMAPQGENVESGSRRVLTEILTELNHFLERHGAAVQGDFVKRFYRSKMPREAAEALGEISAARDILAGNSPFGTVTGVEAIPEITDKTEVKTPEFRITRELPAASEGGTKPQATALVEVKTIGSLGQRAIKGNLNKAIGQIRYQAIADATPAAEPAPSSAMEPTPVRERGLIRIDVTTGGASEKKTVEEQNDEILRWIKGELIQERATGEVHKRGTDYVEYVEVIYLHGKMKVITLFRCQDTSVTIQAVQRIPLTES